jgi:hypothetical protein
MSKRQLYPETTVSDHKAYYRGAHELHLRVTGERKAGKLLGVQLLGHKQSEVSKRIDVYATALFHCMDVEELNDLDLSYTPPLSSPWDPIQMAAQAYSVRLAVMRFPGLADRPKAMWQLRFE